MKKMYTDYGTAVKWCNNNIILFNDIVEHDECFYEDNYDLFEDEKGNQIEYFQYYLTDMSKFDAEWLQKTFDLTIGFSRKFDMYVLCVPHCGTSWKYVPCEVFSEDWWRINKAEHAFKD